MFNISIGGNPTPLWAMADYALMCYRYVSIPLHVTSRAHALMHSRYLRVLTDLQLAMPVLCDIMRESGVKAAIVSYELLDKLRTENLRWINQDKWMYNNPKTREGAP